MGKFFGKLFGRSDEDYENEEFDDDMEMDEDEDDEDYGNWDDEEAEDDEDYEDEDDDDYYGDPDDEDIEEDEDYYGNSDDEDIEDKDYYGDSDDEDDEDGADYEDSDDEDDEGGVDYGDSDNADDGDGADYRNLNNADEDGIDYGEPEDGAGRDPDNLDYREQEGAEDGTVYGDPDNAEDEDDANYGHRGDEDAENDGDYRETEEKDIEDDMDYSDSDGDDIEDSDDPEYGDFEDEDYPEDEDDEWDEDDRRIYRRRRRIRNQIIAYSVVFIFLAALAAGGVTAGKNIAKVVKDKKQAEAQEQQQAEQDAQDTHEIVIDPPEEPIVEEPEVDYLGGIVEACISSMPLEDKVAGLFVVTPEALTGVSTATQAGEGTQEALNTYAVGGLIYFDKNIKDKEQITEMLSSTTSKSKYPIFLAVDEEGGSVSRVAKSGIDVIEVGDMASIGESGDTAQAYEAGLTIGTYLKELGFNVDFAPVADVAGSGESALGDRIFGADAKLVGDMVSNMVEGIEGTKVSSCLKHFPGIGDNEKDTHDGRVETTKTLEEMRNSNFIPFQAGIAAGADFVMVSHVTASAVDEDAVPSTLSSKIMTDILRNELNFQGIIITDAMNMSAITEYYTSEQAAVKAIEAGADMLLMPEDFEAAYAALLAAVQDGTIPEERINESLERIYRVKYADKLPEE